VPRHQRNAVERNRLKRRLRELVRTILLPHLRTQPSVDIVIRARREAYGVPIDLLRADVTRVRDRVASGQDA